MTLEIKAMLAAHHAMITVLAGLVAEQSRADGKQAHDAICKTAEHLVRITEIEDRDVAAIKTKAVELIGQISANTTISQKKDSASGG